MAQSLTQAELEAMVAAMEQADEDDYEDDGQPDEYTEWQDYMDGDDWDQGQYETEDYFDGGVDF